MQKLLLVSVLVLAVIANVHCQKLGLVASIFSSNMVLQRAPQRSNVWGWTNTPNEAVKVDIAGNTFLTQSASQAPFRWSLSLPAIEGSPTAYTLTVNSLSSGKVTLQNVLFGDVFLCGGQSNMQMGVIASFNGSQAVAMSGNYPLLRLYTVGQNNYSTVPLQDFARPTQTWQVSSPQSVGNGPWTYFSATCYYFGVQHYAFLGGNVPIGLLSDNWGGTIVEAWMSQEALSSCGINPAPPTAPASAPTAPPQFPNFPSVLYNAMIYPIINLRIRGFTWYQGESNMNNPKGYQCTFPAMISDWRVKFGYGTNPAAVPFVYVQLAPWLGISSLNLLAEQRAAQLYANILPSVGFATAMDKGDPDTSNPYGSIHPRDKAIVGLRVFQAMSNLLYPSNGTNTLWTGPLLEKAQVSQTSQGTTVVLTFRKSSLGQGLNNLAIAPSCPVTTVGYCAGFEVRGSDNKWYPATIRGATLNNQLYIDTQLPSGVTAQEGRYGWANWPIATVYNSNMSPFLPSKFNIAPANI